MKGEEPTLQMNMTSNDTAIKTEYFTMRFFHILGLCESLSHSGKQALGLLLLFQLDEEMTEFQTPQHSTLRATQSRGMGLELCAQSQPCHQLAVASRQNDFPCGACFLDYKMGFMILDTACRPRGEQLGAQEIAKPGRVPSPNLPKAGTAGRAEQHVCINNNVCL